MTNKLPAKTGNVPIPSSLPDSSFLIKNSKPKKEEIAVEIIQKEDLEEENEEFPFDFEPKTEKSTRKTEKTRDLKADFPVEKDNLVEIKKKAREKVQNWLKNSEQKRIRGLEEIGRNYKK